MLQVLKGAGTLALTEAKGAKDPYTLSGTFSGFDSKNQNDRYYTRALWENVVAEFAPKVTNRNLMGELDHPVAPKEDLNRVSTVKLAEASHVITEMKIDGDRVFGTIELLNTPAGQIAKALVDAKVPINVSSRALGSLVRRDGKSYVDEATYAFTTFDLVADPSFVTACLNEGSDSDLTAKIQKIAESDPKNTEAIYAVWEGIQKTALKTTEKVDAPDFTQNTILSKNLGIRLSQGTLSYGDALALKRVFTESAYSSIMDSVSKTDENDFEGQDDALNIGDKVLALEERVAELSKQLFGAFEELLDAQTLIDRLRDKDLVAQEAKKHTAKLDEQNTILRDFNKVFERVNSALPTKEPENITPTMEEIKTDQGDTTPVVPPSDKKPITEDVDSMESYIPEITIKERDYIPVSEDAKRTPKHQTLSGRDAHLISVISRMA